MIMQYELIIDSIASEMGCIYDENRENIKMILLQDPISSIYFDCYSILLYFNYAKAHIQFICFITDDLMYPGIYR